MKILVADDDPGIVDVTKIILEQAGYTVLTAPDAVTTMKQITEQKPSLILLDIWLAGENGAVLAKKLKGEDSTKHIPIIMVSANNNVEKMAKDAGADDFIAKPFDIDILENMVQKYLQN